MEGTGSPGIVVISLEDEEMDKLRKELEVLKSWGIESIPVDKVLSMIKEAKDDKDETAGEDCIRTVNHPCKEESGVDAFFKGITSITIDVHSVGGTIFYIDDTSDGVYEFFDGYGNLIENVQVGDRPYYYRVVKKGPADKYYVYHDAVYDKLEWTYYKGDVPVYESLGTSGDEGSGKTNTEIVMAKDNGAYTTANSNGIPTIWYQLQMIRDAKVGGCNDWFIPSVYEINELREAILLGSVTGGKIAGSYYGESIFGNKWLWSSSEDSVRESWHWSSNGQNWYTYGKNFNNSVFFIRAF